MLGPWQAQLCDIQGRLFENAGKQQQICAEHTNSKCVGPNSVVISDKSAHFDVTDALTGVIQGSCGIDAEKEKALKEKYGFSS